MWPILIPSKGRPNGATFKMLAGAGIKYTAFVEPQELKQYSAAGVKGVSTLNRSGAGLEFARQSILDYATAKGYKWYWTLDDDINSFSMRSQQAKTGYYHLAKAEPKEAFQLAELTINQPGAGIGCMASRIAGMDDAGDPCGLFQCCCQVVAINVRAAAGLKYRYAPKEDKDFTAQICAAGYMSIVASQVVFNTQQMNPGGGGLKEIYDQRKDESAAELVCQQWRGFAKLYTSKRGRKDVRLNYKAIYGAGKSAMSRMA